MVYRRDIDGLRAVAVLSVLFYHVGLGCPGGFVGVDVFFVISGYLITLMLRASYESGHLRLGEFWKRRIRRLFPALLVVLVPTSLVSMYLLLPEDQIRVGQLLIAQPFICANLVLWRVIKAGYFGESSETCPCLHTWSLALEEQFYLFFPLLLNFLLSRAPARFSRILLALGFLSFFVCQASLQGHPTRVFYLLPFRAWELLLGCWTASIQWKAQQAVWREIASLGGICLVLLPVLKYSQDTPFPGWAALPPCAGTALLLAANAPGLTWTGRLLSLRPLVAVGLISYSLYLWHWPLIAFRSYMNGLAPLSLSERVGLILFSLLAGGLSWRFVEKPARYSIWLKTGVRTWIFFLMGSSLMICLGGWILYHRGFPEQWTARALAYSDSRYSLSFAREVEPNSVQDLQMLALGDSKSEQIDFILWGDSHAMALAPALDSLARRYHQFGVEWTRTSTPPVLSQSHPARDGPARNQVNDVCRRLIVERKVKHVVLAAYWNYYLEREPDFGLDLIRTVAILQNMGVQVWIAKDVPKFACFPPLSLAVGSRFGYDSLSCSPTLSQYESDNQRMEEIFSRLPGSIRFLDPVQPLLTADHKIRIENAGISLFRDDHHLSNEGAAFIQDSLLALFKAN
ncbi:acyltransferase [bacterium]|nr:acyltransferase [bacterium]